MPKKRFDLETFYRHTMSQELARKNPDLADYAMNLYGQQIAMVNVALKLVDDPEERMQLEVVKEVLMEIGRSLWIAQASELTNLGLALGTPIKEASLKGRK